MNWGTVSVYPFYLVSMRSVQMHSLPFGDEASGCWELWEQGRVSARDSGIPSPPLLDRSPFSLWVRCGFISAIICRMTLVRCSYSNTKFPYLYDRESDFCCFLSLAWKNSLLVCESSSHLSHICVQPVAVASSLTACHKCLGGTNMSITLP